MKPVHNSTPTLLLLICLLSLLIRMWGITFGLPGIDHGDESEVVNHALRFGSGDLNPHRFQYGTLVQYLLFIVYGCAYVIGSITGKFHSLHHFAIQFVKDPTPFYLIARTLSACFGVATVLVTYRMGRRLRGEVAGVLAALMLALCYQHVIHSHYATVDAALTFFFTCAVYRSLTLLSDNRLSMYLYAGLLTGLAVGTKFNGVIALVAFAASHVAADKGPFFYKCMFSGKWLLGLSAFFAGHFLTCPYFYFDFNAALDEIIHLQAFHAFSGFNFWYYMRDFIQDYWGIPAGALCAIAITRYMVTREVPLRILALTALGVIAFASLHRYVEAKYILPAFPLCAVLGATLFLDILSPLHNKYHPFILLLMLLLFIHPLYLIVRWDADRAEKSITLESKEWIEQNIPSKAKILLDNAGNAGPKLWNAPENVKRQYERARAHNLLKAEFLKLQLEAAPAIYYDIVEIDSAAGSRSDDYLRYRLWQDTDEIGQPPSYYCKRGYDYIVVTQRYFSLLDSAGFKLMKDFTRGHKEIRIYKLSCGPS